MHHNAQSAQRTSSVKTPHNVVWELEGFFGNGEHKSSGLEYKGIPFTHNNLVHKLFGIHFPLQIKVGVGRGFERLHHIPKIKVQGARPELFFKIGRRVNDNPPFAYGLFDISVRKNHVPYSTLTPMLFAVPAIIFVALSRSFVFKSAIFFSATSFNCAFVMVATVFLLGVPEPFSKPIAFLISAEACGWWSLNVKVLFT